MIKALKSTKERFRRRTKRIRITPNETEENLANNNSHVDNNKAGQEETRNDYTRTNIQMNDRLNNANVSLRSNSYYAELWDTDNSDD